MKNSNQQIHNKWHLIFILERKYKDDFREMFYKTEKKTKILTKTTKK